MKELILSKECPPIYERLKRVFPIDWDDGVIIAYGMSVFCKYDLPPQKVIHELVHCKRQEAMGKELWWDLYLAKDSFRLEEEVLAYKAEYKFFCENVRDRNQRFEYLYELAQNLSSKQYDLKITGDEALRIIQG